LKTGIFARESPSLELWEFAARYSFDEMEQYCRKDANVLYQIDSIMSDPGKGMEYFLSRHLPVSFLTRLVYDLLKRRTQDVAWLRHCIGVSTAEEKKPSPTAGNLISSNRPAFSWGGHTKAYDSEDKRGRFRYADPYTAHMVCPFCSDLPRPWTSVGYEVYSGKE
jgi:hypothetical protein